MPMLFDLIVVMAKATEDIKTLLENLYDRYNRSSFIGTDPLSFVYNYSNPADMEIVGFLCAALAYGRVEQIQKSLTRLFEIMAPSPYELAKNFSAKDRKKLSGFKHRFTDGQAIAELFAVFKKVLRKYGTLENFFSEGFNQKDDNIINALSKFCGRLLDMAGNSSRPLKYLLVQPENKSPCKRLNLFLRWMVRSDDVDPGLWKSIDKSKLIVPIDVHMARLSRILGFTKKKNMSLSAAVEITKAFAKIAPDDPVKYDFALTRIGIVENCTGRYKIECNDCEIFEICLPGEKN